MALLADRAALYSEHIRDAREFAQLRFVDLEGKPLPIDPIDLVIPSSVEKPHFRTFSGSWTGEMVAITAATSRWESDVYLYRWWLWRVLPDGTLLDEEAVLLADTSNLQGLSRLVWAGDDLWLFGQARRPDRAIRTRVVCSCTDDDFDGFSPCERDCDDGSPDANPAGVELCRGGVDEDCDGLFDCADDDCTESPGPGPVGGLLWTGSGWAWNETPAAEVYDLTRGLMSNALRRGDFRHAECSGRDLAVPEWSDDGRAPPVGDALWYLVRAEGAPCATSGWGTSSSGEPRTARDCL